MILNNVTKQRQNGFKIGTRDKHTIHLRKVNFISNQIVISCLHIFFFFTIRDLPIQFSIYTSCPIHHVYRVQF